jgi:hypothetical protein
MNELNNWVIETELALILSLIFIHVIRDLREDTASTTTPEQKTRGFREVNERIEW